ncbi:MAG: hypothetical protein FD169_730 [Bacillota bacterium]|nr:MAG: hypothetical protein FD169_730 [Bacillota bacterium]
MSISTNPWVWIMGIGMVSLFSFIYKENAAYRFFEHVFVGAAAGYFLQMNYVNILDRAWIPLVAKGRYSLLIPIFLGLLLYTRFFKRYAWLSRWATSFMIGIGVGISSFGMINAQLIRQASAAMMPFLVKDKLGVILWTRSANNTLMILGTLSVLVYFFFSYTPKGPVKEVTHFGRWVMMLTFGVAFGNVVMGRISLLLGAFERIFGTWLGLL